MSNLSDNHKKKGIPIKNPKKRPKYSKEDDSEPLNLVFTFKTVKSDESIEESSENSPDDSDEYEDSTSDSEEDVKLFPTDSSIECAEKELNYNKYILLVDKKHKNLSEYDYFMSLPIPKQQELLTKISDMNLIQDSSIPFRIKILNLSIPTHYKQLLLTKYNHFITLMPFDPSYHKLKQWIDSFLEIPLGKYYQLPVTILDGIDSCQSFMENAKDILDQTVYGLNDVKYQIMQFIGNHISNPTSIGSAIAIKGPMGTGKTTLIKEGISKILNRPFELIALGGATDSCFLEGHSYTYEGSMYGKIVEILMKTKCMNPIIYFDELDKVSATPKGDEIIGILTHLIDSSQNEKFHDRYFSEVDFDLSKCLFIFSYNDESLVNPILRDRMYTIHVDGYDTKDKIVIANQYLIPSISHSIRLSDIIIPNETMQYIIETYSSEKGVRNLKRCIETIYSKLNLYRLIKPTSKLFNEDAIQIKFPFTVTIEHVKLLIKIDKKEKSYYNLYL
jgi:ATP-dependent Lon protease